MNHQRWLDSLRRTPKPKVKVYTTREEAQGRVDAVRLGHRTWCKVVECDGVNGFVVHKSQYRSCGTQAHTTSNWFLCEDGRWRNEENVRFPATGQE